MSAHGTSQTLEAFKQAARPFSIYLAALTVAGGVFAPWVTPEKIGLALLLGGFTAGLRSLDKRAPAPPAP